MKLSNIVIKMANNYKATYHESSGIIGRLMRCDVENVSITGTAVVSGNGNLGIISIDSNSSFSINNIISYLEITAVTCTLFDAANK